LPGGAIIEQSDGTGWMAFFCLHTMRIALELSRKNSAYENLAIKFFEHFIGIAVAMKKAEELSNISCGMGRPVFL
jgi:hypothetical protein